jgi:5-formaminoimidazole-4-carboxamide-1-beta-D-ribofuranosyl 5'-monophosphate synthetase
MAIFLMTMVMVVIFEIGVRVDGGFNAYMQGTIYSSYKAFREEGIASSYFKEHKKRARWVFLAIIITSIMGTSMYPILFIL